MPALNRCAVCRKSEADHNAGCEHDFNRDASLPEWHGWHAFRRGLGSNLYALGVRDKKIQEILRHANVSTTATYYIKIASADAQEAMARLEEAILQLGNERATESEPSETSVAIN